MSSLPRTSASSLGIDERHVLAALDAVEERGLRMRSLMVARHGAVGVELSWGPHVPEQPIHTHSFTKSVVAMLAGSLVHDGLLSEDDLVIDRLPRYRDLVDDPEGRLSRLRVRHLLSMTSGRLFEPAKQGVDDEVLAFLEKPLDAEPGERFSYSSAGVNMLSSILEHAGGSSLEALMRDRVLGPIGIRDFHMERCQTGAGKGSGGLSLTTEDMTRVCLLLLQDGSWNGHQVIPEAWARRMGSVEVEVPLMAAPQAWAGLRQGYGLLTWGCPDAGARVLYGLNGQFGIVLDKLDAVIVTAAAEPDASRVLDLVCEFLIPALSPSGDALAPDQGATEELARRAKAIGRGRPIVDAIPHDEAVRLWTGISDNEYVLLPEPASLLSEGFLSHVYTTCAQERARTGIEGLTLSWEDGHASISYVESGVKGSIPVGTQGWYERGTLRTMWGEVEVLSRARWTQDGSLEIEILPVGSEYAQTLTLVRG